MGGVFFTLPEFLSALSELIRSHYPILLGILVLCNILTLVAFVRERTRRRAGETSPEVVLEMALTVKDTQQADETPSDGKKLNGVGIPNLPSNLAHKNWLVVRASAAGKSHEESNPPIPCQDSSYYHNIGQGWGVAVVCDGAGSKEYSHYGSQFVAKQAGLYFEQIVRDNVWQSNSRLPLQEQWHEISKRALAKIRSDLEEYAKEHELDADSLSSTVIVVLHSPAGILATHIGDGRAAFCNAENNWKAVIKPHKGEEANQTVFLTSVDWNDADKYIESTLVEEPPFAFVLLSDGCESHSFEVNICDEEHQKYTDPNKPYSKFFAPLVATLRAFHRDGVPDESISEKWQQFIEAGNEGFRNEPDDKTMVLGVVVE